MALELMRGKHFAGFRGGNIDEIKGFWPERMQHVDNPFNSPSELAVLNSVRALQNGGVRQFPE